MIHRVVPDDHRAIQIVSRTEAEKQWRNVPGTVMFGKDPDGSLYLKTDDGWYCVPGNISSMSRVDTIVPCLLMTENDLIEIFAKL